MAKRLTIRDIAKEAGVSTATVSRYLNGHFEYMSSETKERIHSIIKERNYRPSLVAKGLKVDKAYLFGVVLPHVNTTLASTVIRSICMACNNTNYNPIFISIEDDESREIQMIQRLLDYRIEGIITLTGSNVEYYKELNTSGIPVIMCDRGEGKAPLDSIIINHYDIVWDTLNRLNLAGYELFGMLTYDLPRMASSTLFIRERAFNDYCTKYHLENFHYKIDFNSVNNNLERILRYVQSHFKDKKKVIFIPSASLLYHTERIMDQLCIPCPEEIGLFGYDIPREEFYIPRHLTVIEQPLMEMAQKAASFLIQRIDGSDIKSPMKIVLSASLKVRKSVEID